MRPSWVEVDLTALENNINEVRKTLRDETSIMFIVKDRAYGHGVAPIVRKAWRCGVTWFGVAYVQEALEVRKEAPAANILVLGAAEHADVPVLLEKNIIPIMVSKEHGEMLASGAAQFGARLNAHMKIDTGMGRLGVPWEQASYVFRGLHGIDGLQITGLCTHFASVEVKKPSMGAMQMERFQAVEQEIRDICGKKLFRHVSSSRAILYHKEWDLDAVRPGILLYGYGSGEPRMRFKTRPLLQWKASIMQIKELPANSPVGYYGTYVTQAPTKIATIAAGYADGYHRALSNKGFVLIGGRRCPVVGRVSMNWITADVGLDCEAKSGDEAVLIGTQGAESVWADELAKLARTIPYELLTSINPFAVRTFAG